MGSPLVQPPGSIVRRYPATDMHSPGPGPECIASGIFIPGAKHDDMAAGKIVSFVKLCVIRRRRIRGKIRLQEIAAFIPEGRADDLFYPAPMEVDTWSETHGLSLMIDEAFHCSSPG
jgi:hypothetical protein